MKIKPLLALALLSTLNLQLSTLHAQGTAFTYQGRLNSGSNLASGIYDVRFTIYDSTNNPGTIIAGPLTNSATPVSNGLFTVTLDFGAGVFTGAERWMEVAVRTSGGGPFSALSPRQRVTAAPYAITAGSFTGPLPATQFGGTYGNTVTLNNTANQFQGTFAGDGSALNNLSMSNLRSGAGFRIEPVAFTHLNAYQGELGFYTTDLAFGDINGDGRTDIVATDNSVWGTNGTLIVITNRGDGTMALSQSIPGIGKDAYSVAVADLNNDGWPDVVRANTGRYITSPGNTLSIFINFNGSLFPAGTVTTGSKPLGVVATDVSGDNQPDLIVANSGDNTVSVFVNTGGASFALAGTHASQGAMPVAIAVADFNRDSRKDLFVVNAFPFGGFGGVITLLTNSGGASFNLAYAAAQNSQSFLTGTAADMNADGIPDLVVANSVEALVLLNNGSGTVTLARYYYIPFHEPSAVGDLNADGFPDLVQAGSTFDGGLDVYVNFGDGRLTREKSLPLGYRVNVVRMADLDSDGLLDVVAPGSQYLEAYLNRSGASAAGWLTVRRDLNIAGTNGQRAIVLSTDQSGSIELGNSRVAGVTPYVDFHYGVGGEQDYNVRLINDADGQLMLNGNGQITGNLGFGAQTRQMLNLWSTGYGIGVQSSTLYNRSDGHFVWFRGGVHNDAQYNAGGGEEIMRLSSQGGLHLGGQ